MRKTIAANNMLDKKQMAKKDRGEVSYDEETRVATITLIGVSEESAERAARIAAIHTKKES